MPVEFLLFIYFLTFTENMQDIDLFSLQKNIRETFPDKHIGFKKCRNGLIVVLEILGENNENRRAIRNMDHATMRCSKAYVLKIFDMIASNVAFSTALAIYDETFEYKVDQIVEPKEKFDTYLDRVSGSGIHYFRTLDPAFFWNYIPNDGLKKEWYDNGHLKDQYSLKDGKRDGPAKSWFDDGQLWEQIIYKDDVFHGLYESWYENGRKQNVATYNNGNLDGEYVTWHDNGVRERQCVYKNGQIDGYDVYYLGQGKIARFLNGVQVY